MYDNVCVCVCVCVYLYHVDVALATHSDPPLRHFAPCPRDATQLSATPVVSFPYWMQRSLHWTYLYWERRFHPGSSMLVRAINTVGEKGSRSREEYFVLHQGVIY